MTSLFHYYTLAGTSTEIVGDNRKGMTARILSYITEGTTLLFNAQYFVEMLCHSSQTMSGNIISSYKPIN
jgi:hypothetical protein